MAATDLPTLIRRYERLGAGDVGALLTSYARRVLAPRGRQVLREEIARTTRRRSGSLEQAIESSVEQIGDDLTMRLLVRHPAARVLGGEGTTTIRSRRPGGALAIPVGPALDSTGGARYQSPRQVPVELRLVVSRGQSATLRDESGQVWYVLKKSVQVRGRGFLVKASRKWTKENARLLGAYLRRLVRGEREDRRE